MNILKRNLTPMGALVAVLWATNAGGQTAIWSAAHGDVYGRGLSTMALPLVPTELRPPILLPGDGSRGAFPEFVAGPSGEVYMARDETFSDVHAIDPTTGADLWVRPGTYPTTDSSGRVYISTASNLGDVPGSVTCYAADGSPVWAYATPLNAYRVNRVTIAPDGSVYGSYFSPSGMYRFKLTAAGAPVWVVGGVGEQNYFWTGEPPVVTEDGGLIWLGLSPGQTVNVRRYDPVDGHLVWTNFQSSDPPLVLPGNRVLVIGTNASGTAFNLVALNAVTGQQTWASPLIAATPGGYSRPALLPDGRIFWINGTFFIHSAETGQLLSSIPRPAGMLPGQAHPVIGGDGTIYVWKGGSDAQNYGGQLWAIDSGTGAVYFRYPANPVGCRYAPQPLPLPDGRLFVAWVSRSVCNDPTGAIYHTTFERPTVPAQAAAPQALAVDAAGNGVFQPNESVVMAPTWRNTGSAAIALTGALTNHAGPAGPSYGIPDASADYGTIAVSGANSCTTTGNCYSVSNAATTRPATHWDSTVLETVTPTATTKTWTLHMGDSFTDVPPSSGFYRFIETILHKNVTGGCAASAYCPGASTTREQMAVFVLVAKEPPGYTPPPCGATPMFADVPASSPLCRWVEELARRGVVSGCGGGNYCPSSPASREQMAVFVLRTLDPALNPPACGTPMFADVPASSPFCRWIEELARRGVATGCGGGNYCPTAAVSREQMSVYLSVTFGLTLYGL